MKLLTQAALQDAVARLGDALDRTLAALFPTPLQLQPAFAYAGTSRAAPARSVDLGGPILYFATIRDMLRGHGRLQREVPGQWLDREYEEVVAAAKKGDQTAKKAKKLAEQGKRLLEKLKGK
jgi:hypothetical protein